MMGQIGWNWMLSNCDILRVSEKYRKYRYAKKTQISLDPKKYQYVGGIEGFRDAINIRLHSF